jgi:hypothetical protein
MTRALAGLVLIAAVALAGCRTAPLYDASDIAFNNPPTSVKRVLTQDDYRDAIIRGGAKRNWTFEDAGPGHLVGSVGVRGKHFATVDVVFDTERFSITHKTSTNLNYNGDTRVIHPNYNSWVHLLQDDIQSEITRLKAS